MDPRQRLEQNHAEPDPLHRVQDPKPEPQAPTYERAGDAAPGPGDILADIRRSPEHLAPSRGAEADGEDGQDPAVVFGKHGEEEEEAGPDEAEEGDDEEDDLVGFGVVGGPEVAPVAAVGGAEEIVLDEDGDEEPDYDAPAEEGGVE